MLEDEFPTEQVTVSLPDGSSVKIEVSDFGREEVSFKEFSFNEISDALCGMTVALKGAIEKAKPRKASIKFGLEVGVESGSLTAIIVKGSGKANLEVTLEWGE